MAKRTPNPGRTLVVFFLVTLPPLANAALLLYAGVFVFYSAPPLRFKAR